MVAVAAHSKMYPKFIRSVYLTDQINVCSQVEDCDTIEINVELDGEEVMQVLAYGGTLCSQWPSSNPRVQAGFGSYIWDYVDGNTRMVFDDADVS